MVLARLPWANLRWISISALGRRALRSARVRHLAPAPRQAQLLLLRLPLRLQVVVVLLCMASVVDKGGLGHRAVRLGRARLLTHTTLSAFEERGCVLNLGLFFFFFFFNSRRSTEHDMIIKA